MVAGRLGRMGIVAGMHVAAFYMIATSLGIIHTEVPPTTDTFFVPDTRPPDDPVPVTEPVVNYPSIPLFPEPDVVPVDQGENVITGEQVPIDRLPPRDSSGTAVVEPRIPIVAPRIDARRPLSQPPYPAADVRAGNEGNADLEVYVLPNGRVGDARIVRSTGFERLDRSAIEEAKRHWRLVPGSRNGEPEAQWYKVRVTFKITNQ
jgi:protein TonB